MKKVTSLLSVLALLSVASVSASFAASPHPGGNPIPPPLTIPILGNFQAICMQGSASIDVRTSNSSGRSQSVIHCETQSGSSVQANVLNLNSAKLTKPIKFDLVSGVGQNLILVIRYTIPHTTLTVTVPYGIPGQAKLFTGQRDLTPVGRGTGTFQIPIGRSGGDIPPQAALDLLYFYQGATLNPTCDIAINEVNDLNLNGRIVPIDMSTASSSCTGVCVSER